MPHFLPPTGLWVSGLDLLPRAEVAALLGDLEQRGPTALWLSEGTVHDPFVDAAAILAATERLTVGIGVAVVHGRHPRWLRASARAVADSHPGRFQLGLGVSNRWVVEELMGLEYGRPLAVLGGYLDGLDAPDPLLDLLGVDPRPPVPRLLGALGPRALDLAASRADGAITYLTTPEHTRSAREALGPERTLVVEQSVVVDTPVAEADRRARAHLAGYGGLPAYRGAWQRLGLPDPAREDLGRLVEHLVPTNLAAALVRAREHLDAGASHVCFQALAAAPTEVPGNQWRLLAEASV